MHIGKPNNNKANAMRLTYLRSNKEKPISFAGFKNNAPEIITKTGILNSMQYLLYESHNMSLALDVSLTSSKPALA